MKESKLFISIVGISLSSLFLRCSLPADVEPVKWQMHVEIPIIDRQITIADVIHDTSLAGLHFDLGDTNASGDTVSISKTGSLQYVIEKQLGTTDTSVIEDTLGARPLKNTSLVDVLFGLGTNLPATTLPDLPLPSPVPLSQSKENPLNGIQSVIIDSSSPALDVTVANLSASADLQNVLVSLSNGQNMIGSVQVGNLPAQSSKIVSLSIAGRTIRNTITVTVSVTIPSGAVVRTADGIRVAFSLDNQRINEAVVNDSLVDYSDLFTGNFCIADSMRINAIDIDSALLRCELTNPSLLKLAIVGILDNAWKMDYAVLHNLQSVEQLRTAAIDSSGFAGGVVDDTLFESAATTAAVMTVPIESMRIFPFWNPDSGKSFVGYHFKVRSIPAGRPVRFRKNDVFSVKLITDRFPFVRISGNFMKVTERTFSSNKKVGFDWKPSITDSLKKSLHFQSTRIQLHFVPGLPAGSSIDSLLIHITMRGQGANSDSVVINKALAGIFPDSLYSTTVDISSLLNAWPDSLIFDARLSLPSGTGLLLYNLKDPHGDYASSLAIDMAVNWTIVIPLCWEVADTIRTELEQSSWKLKEDELNWVKNLQRPSVRIHLNAFNHTNLDFALFALGAAARYQNELQSVPISRITTSGSENLTNTHLFSLFGNDGFRLAGREKESTIDVQLDQRGIDALLANDSCLIRWFLVIPAGDTDAFRAADYLDLKGMGVVEGIGNTDSLLYE